MRTLAVLALTALGAMASPAFGQSVMKDYSWPDMRAALVEQGVEVTKEGISGEQRFLSGKDKTGLVFAVYGAQCDNPEITQRYTGADIISSFTLKDPSKINEILEMIDYAALGDYKGDDGRFKVSRYVIFDGGITHENLKTNLEVFLRLSNDIWDKLDDAKLLN
jgi:hypothetical protein